MQNENSEDIIYTYGDKSAVVYEGDKTLRYLLTYIDNALYFMEYDCIYRIEFAYNSDGSIINQHLSFVCNKPYSIVKAETNKLILCSYNYDKKYEYFEFDTLSGKMNKIDYNYTVDANEYNFRISADDAYNIAYNEIQNDKYSSNMNNMFYNYVIRVDHSEITLICKPDLNNQHYLYERYPEYVWKVVLVDLKSSTHSVEVYVNAQTGTVCSVSTYYYD